MSTPSPALVTDTAPVISPVSGKERIHVLDILRGFALFGILLVNIDDYLGKPMGNADSAANWLMQFLAEGKFYPLFSFLFGVGFAIQMGRAEAKGARFISLYIRRLLSLLLIAVAYYIFLEDRHILLRYAVLGFPLLLFRHCSLKTILLWAVISMAVAVGFNSAIFTINQLRRANPATAQAMDRVSAEQRTQLQELKPQIFEGNYIESSIARAKKLVYTKGAGVIGGNTFIHLTLPLILAMFLLGVYAVRRGVFHDVATHRLFIRKVMWWGLGLGFVGTLASLLLKPVVAPYFSVPEFQSSLNGVVLALSLRALSLSGVGLTLFYASAITLLVQEDAWLKRLSFLSWVGRMALTNYMMQSFFMTLIFFGYGLGVTAGPAMGWALTLAIFSTHVPLSIWWLRRFKFGPMEWVWRSLTYLKP
ncbi:MAG: DUF418 domain-containing protein, partial [Nitrospirales bacterium]